MQDRTQADLGNITVQHRERNGNGKRLTSNGKYAVYSSWDASNLTYQNGTSCFSLGQKRDGITIKPPIRNKLGIDKNYKSHTLRFQAM